MNNRPTALGADFLAATDRPAPNAACWHRRRSGRDPPRSLPRPPVLPTGSVSEAAPVSKAICISLAGRCCRLCSAMNKSAMDSPGTSSRVHALIECKPWFNSTILPDVVVIAMPCSVELWFRCYPASSKSTFMMGQSGDSPFSQRAAVIAKVRSIRRRSAILRRISLKCAIATSLTSPQV